MGIDWDSPIPMEDNEDTIVLDGLPEFLDVAQKVELRDLLSLSVGNLFQREMLSQFALAKTYVSQTSLVYPLSLIYLYFKTETSYLIFFIDRTVHS